MPKTQNPPNDAMTARSRKEHDDVPPGEAMRNLLAAIHGLQAIIRSSAAPAWVREDFLGEADFQSAHVLDPDLRRGISGRLGQPLGDHVRISDATRLDLAGWAVARERIAKHIGELWYTKEDNDGRYTEKLHGWIMASAPMAVAVRHVNAQKEIFQRAAKKSRSLPDPWVLLGSDGRDELLEWRRKLGGSGLGQRICLRQAYRKAHLIESVVTKIGYSFSTHSKNITPVKRKEIEEALDAIAQQSESVKQQTVVLANLPDSERMVRVQNATPHYKANLVCLNGLDVVRLTLKCGMPFFIREADFTPAFTRRMDVEDRLAESVGARLPRTRLPRSDVAIDPSPLLKSLRVHVSHAKQKGEK